MALENFKITPGIIGEKGVIAAPDKMTGTASENKKIFDRLIREAVAENLNGMIDELKGYGVECCVRYRTDTVGYIRLGADDVLEVSADGTNWQATGSSGHIILDKSGAVLPQRSRMRFVNSVARDENGVTVIEGIKGDKGDTGDRGEQGLKGDTGAVGARGATGVAIVPAVDTMGNIGFSFSDNPVLPPTVNIRGPQGTQGVQGGQGVPGSAGIQGIQGVQGAQGGIGEKGDTGPKGDKGDQGVQGIQGVQGLRGASGGIGAKGDTGPAGAQGPIGAQGIMGNAGADGRSFVIQDVYATLGELKLAFPTGNEFAYQVSFDKNIYIWSELLRGWESLGKLQGPQGAQGIQGSVGAKGDTGAKGEKGDTGAQGVAGVQGAQGIQGETGSKGDRGADGVQGVQGIQGVSGAQGPRGVQGEQGQAGQSAYTSAVNGGYVGTEPAFNQSLAEVPAHIADGARHITALERSGWNGKAAGDHKHTAADVGAAGLVHVHDDRYYTESETLSAETKAKLGLGAGATPDDAFGTILAAKGTSGGTATALTLVAPGFVLFDGAAVRVKLAVDLGRHPTLNVNNTGAKPITVADGLEFIDKIVAGTWVDLIFNGNAWGLSTKYIGQLSPVAAGSATFSASGYFDLSTYGLKKGHVVSLVVVGAGGGGADGNNQSSKSKGGDGGGSGGVSRVTITLTDSALIYCTVGRGGSGTSGVGNVAQPGGSSSFGSFASATGGNGATGNHGGNGIGGIPGGVSGSYGGNERSDDPEARDNPYNGLGGNNQSGYGKGGDGTFYGVAGGAGQVGIITISWSAQ